MKKRATAATLMLTALIFCAMFLYDSCRRPDCSECQITMQEEAFLSLYRQGDIAVFKNDATGVYDTLFVGNKNNYRSGCSDPCSSTKGGVSVDVTFLVGFAKVNLFIQQGSGGLRETAALSVLDGVSNLAARTAWNAALLSRQGRLPLTLAALGNVGLVTVFGTSSTKKVANILVKELITPHNHIDIIAGTFNPEFHHWEHLILFHRLLYGTQTDDDGNPITLPDSHYECLLDAAPCRGYNGKRISGENAEWECIDRLAGARGCTDVTFDANNGIGYMFYFNLFNSVQPVGDLSLYNPIPIKELALENIVKPDAHLSPPTYEEFDKKNFMAANTITANSYKIHSDAAEGRGRVTFVAGKKIDLNPGFDAGGGAFFDGSIDPTVKAMTCTEPSVTECSSTARIAFDTTDTDTTGDFVLLNPDTSSNPNGRVGASPNLQNTSRSHVTQKFAIVPNPASGIFSILTSEAKPSEVTIYNSIGELILQSGFSKLKFDVDLSSHSPGIYFIKVQTAGEIYRKKIIIQ